MRNFYPILFLFLLVSNADAQSCINAQLEMAASAVGAVNPTTNGPSVANQVITFRNNTNNPTGTTFANYAPPLTATYSFSNQQYTAVTGLTGNYANGMVFGATLNSAALPLYDNLGFLGNAANTNFSSTPYNIGTGINTTTNFGSSFILGARGIQNAIGSTQLTSSFYTGDVTITFSTPVDYPILNFSDFGGFLTTGLNTHTFSLQTKVTSGQTLTLLSGDAGVSVVGGDSIATVVSGTTGTNNFKDGSFMVNQAGLTSITFKTYLQGHNNVGSWSGTAAGNNAGEAIVISVTIPDLVPSKPIPAATTIPNTCPANTYNLSPALPTPIVGQTFEYHSVATAPSAGTLITNLSTYPGPSPVYIFAKDSLTGCYSDSSGEITLATINCTGSACVNANIEMTSTGASTTTNGPTDGAQTITLQNDALNNGVYSNYLPSVDATFSFSNQQVNPTQTSAQKLGMVFGRYTSGGTTIYDNLGAVTAATTTNADFTSNATSTPGTGMNETTNYGIKVFQNVDPLQALGVSLTGNQYYGDLTINFNQPLDYPILHLADMGGLTGTHLFATELELSSPATTLTKLSGDANVVVTNGNYIELSSLTASSQYGDGSFMVNQAGVTSITLKLYMQGHNNVGTWNSTNNAGDAYVISFSVPDRVPSAPVATASSVTITNCPNTTNLTTLQPANIQGTLYEWHTVSTNPTSTTLVSPATAVSAPGNYYLYAKDSLTGCISAADTVNVVACPAEPDTVIAIPTCATCPVTECPTADDIPVGPSTITYSSCGAAPTGFGAQTQDPTTGCVTFTPNGTQGPTDTVITCAIACKDGLCDTTVIIIPPVPPASFPPDTITIPAVSCLTCTTTGCATADDLGGPTGGTTFSCGAPNGYTMSTPDANGCVTFTPSGPLDNIADTACVYTVKNGVADTTKIIIPPPTSFPPDTITIPAVSCLTCTTTGCATADDLGGPTGGVTFSCGAPNGYTMSTPDANGCVTFTPSGPLDNIADTACVYTIKNGIADTTKIIIPPPAPIKPNPDVNTTWAEVPVTGNTSTNDNDIPSGSTYGNPPANASNPDTQIPTINLDGSYTFTSPTVGVYNFKVPLATPGGDNFLVDLKITVLDSAINTNPPSANTDIAITPKNVPVTLNTLNNDLTINTGAGTGMAPGTVIVTTPPANGTATVNTTTGNITYTPNNNFVGVDTLFYSVEDSLGNLVNAMQIITIVDTVTSPNTTLAADDYNTVPTAAPVYGIALNNDTDAEGDAQTITPQITSLPGVGSLTLTPTGAYTFIPVPGYVGPAAFPYSLTDARGATADATIYFLVNANSIPLSLGVILVGNQINANNYLEWTVSKPENIKTFEVEKLMAGNYQSIQIQVPNQSTRYSMVDKNASIASSIYRIKSIGVNGQISFSNTLTLNEKSTTALNIYPNPFTNQFSIKFISENEEPVLVKITDITGKVVRRIINTPQIGKNNLNVDLTNQANGIYQLEISVNGVQQIFKLLKQN